MMMKCVSREEGIQLLQDIQSAYVYHTHHGVLSSVKHSDMDSTNPQLRMTRSRSPPNAGTVSSFRSKQQSMSIHFGLSISHDHS
jgi:hypothetical protein